MVTPNQVQADMPVVSPDDEQFAVVDHMEGSDWIKLKKDARGTHHFIPLSWVQTADDKVRIDRSASQAMQQWSTIPSFEGLKSAQPQT